MNHFSDAAAIHLLLYLAPSILLAIALKQLSGHAYLFSAINIAGTFAHELLHFLVGLVLNAKPVDASLFPEKTKTGFTMGSVSFANLSWYNAAPTCLAPLLLLPITLWFAWWRTRYGWSFSISDIAVWCVGAPMLLSFWPSRTDWILALKSWPIGAVWLAYEYWPQLSPLLH